MQRNLRYAAAGKAMIGQYLERRVAGGGRTASGMSLVPDVETASDAYAGRFAGPVGQFFLKVQGDRVSRLIGVRDGDTPCGAGLRALEVGGGHGQLTRLLLEAGFSVTVQGSAASCSHRIRPLMEEFPDRVSFVESSLWRLPFADGEFDLVIGIRLLAHVERWRELLAEMARVSRRQVVVGYSPITSINLVAPLFYRAKLMIEGDTRPYACYGTGSLIRCMSGFGFDDFAVERQFVVPMAVHRALRVRQLSQAAESICRGLGLTRLFGAPALLSARRAD
ncbi:MAG: class I SAM-dependent methyltransferase [Minwuiales bacterium]|nr:class I SAM-dependent methyltransferase [Minwuiales bacterium]